MLILLGSVKLTSRFYHPTNYIVWNFARCVMSCSCSSSLWQCPKTSHPIQWYTHGMLQKKIIQFRKGQMLQIWHKNNNTLLNSTRYCLMWILTPLNRGVHSSNFPPLPRSGYQSLAPEVTKSIFYLGWFNSWLSNQIGKQRATDQPFLH